MASKKPHIQILTKHFRYYIIVCSIDKTHSNTLKIKTSAFHTVKINNSFIKTTIHKSPKFD